MADEEDREKSMTQTPNSERETADDDTEGVVRLPGNRVARWIWAGFGIVFFGLAMLGVLLPLLPTTPFLLVAAFCFARSSDKLNAWFKSTKLYHQVLEGYVQKRSMSLKAKLAILIPVSILLGTGFALMPNVLIGRIVVVIVWVCHVIYFGFMVKTARPRNPNASLSQPKC